MECRKVAMVPLKSPPVRFLMRNLAEEIVFNHSSIHTFIHLGGPCASRLRVSASAELRLAHRYQPSLGWIGTSPWRPRAQFRAGWLWWGQSSPVEGPVTASPLLEFIQTDSGNNYKQGCFFFFFGVPATLRSSQGGEEVC